MLPSPVPSSAIPLTGERTAPGIPHENYWFRRHEAAYLAALPLCRGRRVVDAGCGEGYGAALVADEGSDVVGVDLDLPTLAHASTAHPAVPFVAANLVALPFAAGSVDTVVTLQVVEHVWDQPSFVAECARVVRTFGMLVLSTPNRLTFSPGSAPGATPANPFHSRELDPAELADLVDSHFDIVRLLGVHHGPRLRSWEATNGELTAQLLAQPAAEWPQSVHDLVASVDADDFVLDAADVDQSLDLLMVAERRP